MECSFRPGHPLTPRVLRIWTPALPGRAGRQRECARRRPARRKFKLYGVRPDTSANVRDVSVPPLGDKRLDCGVNPRLVFAMREAIGREWMDWDLPPEDRETAEQYCKDVKIAVSGGFNPAKIENFEDLQVAADIYGVGSWPLSSCDEHGTSNDYTADAVRVRIDVRWYDLAKAGRKAADNLMLELVQ
jgi:nicotinate phosphoribosyltransferase